MSDFIMEQEVSTSSVDNDVEIMEGFMKVQAIGAVAECYCEHAAISDFAAEAGLTVFSESDDNIMKKAWNATKEFFTKIWEWLKALVKSVINFFTKSSIDRLIVKLEEMKRNGELKNSSVLTGIDITKIDAAGILNLVDEFSDNIKKSSETTDSAAMKGFIERAEAFLKKDNIKDTFKKNEDSDASYYVDVISTLKTFASKDVPSNGRKLLKKLDFDKNNYKKGGTGDDKDKVNKDLVKDIKKAANLVAKAYDTYVDNTVKLVNKILKKNLKADDYKELSKNREAGFKELKDTRSKNDLGTKTETESYAENTDGYYFL
jgi:precorrin-6B methylase 2